MRRRLCLALIGALVAGTMAVPGALPAQADAGATGGVVEGDMTYDWLTNGGPYRFDGVMVGTVGAGAATYAGPMNIHIEAPGNSGTATISGSMPGPITISATCSVSVTQVGPYLVIRLDCTVTIVTPVATVTVSICIIIAGGAAGSLSVPPIPPSVWLWAGVFVVGCT